MSATDDVIAVLDGPEGQCFGLTATELARLSGRSRAVVRRAVHSNPRIRTQDGTCGATFWTIGPAPE